MANAIGGVGKRNSSGGAVKRGGGAAAEFRVSLLGPSVSNIPNNSKSPSRCNLSQPLSTSAPPPPPSLCSVASGIILAFVASWRLALVLVLP